MGSHIIGNRWRQSGLRSQSAGFINHHMHFVSVSPEPRVASALHPSQLGYISQPLTAHPI